MANNRRGGMGFSGRDDDFDDDWQDDDDEVEATRAMEIVDDDFPEPTMMPGTKLPPPDRGGGAPMPRRPVPRARPVELADTIAEDDEGEDATRMLAAVDFAAEELAAAAPEPDVTRIEVRVISGPDRGKHHVIKAGDQLVGRGLDCHIVLADPAVSRKHFRLVRSGDAVEVIDMGGANGTNLNGDRVSRQRLNPGDQLEVGTTVLEFWIDGAAAQRAGFGAPVQATPQAAADAGAGGGRNLGLIIGLVAAGLLVLVGGGVAAWLFIGGSSKPAVEEQKEPADDAKIAGLIKAAKEQLEDHEWGEAVDKLKEAKKLAPDDAEVKGLLAKAMDEVDFSEMMDDGRQALKDKRYAEAISKLKDVPNTSEQFTDAQEMLAEAREEMASTGLDAARAAIEKGDNKAAGDALKAILKVQPKHAEAKLMLAGLDSAPGGDKDGAEDKDKDKDKGKDKGDRTEPSGTTASGQSAKGLMTSGVKAYHNRKWSDAQRSFETVAGGRFDKSERNKASTYASAVKDVALGFSQAESVSSPLKRARAFKKAYAADRRIDGHFGPTLVRKLSAAYVQAGKALYTGHRYPEAADAVREAMNFDPENTEAQKLEQQCIEQAGKLLQKAKEHMNKSNYATARDYARQVTRILPGMDPRAAEAREIRKKASEASVQGDDD